MATVWLLLVLSSTLCTTFTLSLDYSDIQSLGVFCPKRDNCTVQVNRTIYTTSCECDQQCYHYGDCCIDAEVMSSSSHAHSSSRYQNMKCLSLYGEEGVYVTSKCRNAWRGDADIRRKCESEADLADPLLYAPATDTKTNFTYINRYCALCNDVTNELSTWTVALNYENVIGINSTYKNITEEYIQGNLVYQNNSWGLNLWDDEEGGTTFFEIPLSYQKPRNLTPYVRYCRAHVVSTCDARYTRQAIRKKCSAYMAVIYVNKTAYRNGHCALCNYASIRNRKCDLGTTSRARPSMSLSLLLDFNTSDGNRVGYSDRCERNQKYDPFYKKCRDLGCALPGYTLRNGRCARL